VQGTRESVHACLLPKPGYWSEPVTGLGWMDLAQLVWLGLRKGEKETKWALGPANPNSIS